MISVEIKKQIIRRSECAVKQCDLVKEFGLSKTTMSTILANRDTIKSAKVAKGVSKLFHEKHKSPVHEEMERLLMIWIQEIQMKGDLSTQDIIWHKAKLIYYNLNKSTPGTTSSSKNEEEFKTSRGGFLCLRKSMESTASLCMVRLAVQIRTKQRSSLLAFNNF